jgi:hypothetical protein
VFKRARAEQVMQAAASAGRPTLARQMRANAAATPKQAPAAQQGRGNAIQQC